MKHNKKIRFVSIVQAYYPYDRRIRKQCETVIDSGFEVSVICLRNNTETAHEIINGIHIYRVNLRKKRGSKIRYLFEYMAFFILAFIKLNILDMKKNFTIIQVSNLPDFLVFSTIIQKIRGAKIVLDMHEIWPEFYISKYNANENVFMVKLLKFIEKISLNYAQEVITINEAIQEIFNRRSIPDKNITIVMNTIDETIIPQNWSFNKSSNEFRFVYHGTLSELYGVEVAIMAMHKFAPKHPDCKFFIFGDGPDTENLKTLVQKLNLQGIINLMGHVPFDKLITMLPSMNVAILPSKKDKFIDLSFSNKLGEYIFLKIPVIISNLESIQYYFNEDQLTYFTHYNSDELTEKMIFSYENYNIMQEKAENAYKKYRSIKWSIMAERYKNLIISLNHN